MAKFGSNIDDEPTPPVERVVPPKQQPVTETVIINTTVSSAPLPPVTPAPVTPAPVATSAQSQMVSAEAQAEMDKKVLDSQLAKQDEHWMKAYWRPAMGWLYMLMCFCDFVAFPIISMFMPIISKLPYVAWQSLTLSNGGLIHLAFGGILGVTAYGRTQEKINK
jgi:uncharacterized membrane protein